MNRLNDKILNKIFGYFNYDECLILREVNGRFCNLIDKIISNNLVWFKKDADYLDLYQLYRVEECKFIFNNCLVSCSLTNFR